MHVFAKGDRVTQPQYGTGTVTSADERHTVIEFDEHGTRTFSTPMVVLEPTTVTAPDKPKRRRSKKSV